MNLKIVVIALLVFAVVAVGIAFLRPRANVLRSQVASVSQEIVSGPVEEIAEMTAPDTNNDGPTYYYPISDYAARIEEREYGQYFDASNKVNASCGKTFVGYHTGDDLETTEAELEVDVPIKAIATGQIVQKGNVGGYGGLVVQETKLNNERVTVYYGHMDLSSVTKKEGESLQAGEVIGNLGDECTAETDFARKHLHFAIRRGDGSDVRGYVPNSGTLSSWLNPLELLTSLKAK